jgi:hypothetical protein
MLRNPSKATKRALGLGGGGCGVWWFLEFKGARELTEEGVRQLESLEGMVSRGRWIDGGSSLRKAGRRPMVRPAVEAGAPVGTRTTAGDGQR